MGTFDSSWRAVVIPLVLGSWTLAAAPTFAKTPEPPGLFSSPPGIAQAVRPDKAIAGRSRDVKVDRGRLRSARFFLSLPDGVSFEAVRERQQDMGKDRFAWVGHSSGDKRNRVVFGVSGDAVAGSFSYRGRMFKLEPRADGSQVVSEVATDDPAPAHDPILVADIPSDGAAAADNAPAADGGPVIDVLVAYTPSILDLYGTSGTEALIVLAVAEANQAYANSGMNTRLNLVHTALTGYEESGNMGTDLSRLRGTGDGYMDELHVLRDAYGADLVSLIEDEPQYCGIAYLMANVSPGFASSGFSLVHRTCATGYYSFAHEIGHNQGANHDHANAGGVAAYPYAYGHQEPFGGFRTVMAYNCSGGCRRVQHFSNPDINYNSKPTGQADYAHNALAIENTAATVAGFRQLATQQLPPSAPTGLQAAAAGHSAMALSWEDTSDDESGFSLERAAYGEDFAEVVSLPADTTYYLDSDLEADTLYSYRARSWNSQGNSDYSEVAVAATDPLPPAPVPDQLVSADLPVKGRVTGTYELTWSDDGVLQIIRERRSGGVKSARFAYLEHKWVLQIQPADVLVLNADVRTGANTDSFTFAYSSDNANFVDMFVVSSETSGPQQFMLPPSLSGTVYIRVRDNVRQRGDIVRHKIKVDQLLVRAQGKP